MGTGRLKNLALKRAVGLINPATRWENPTLDLKIKVGDRRGSRKE